MMLHTGLAFIFQEDVVHLLKAHFRLLVGLDPLQLSWACTVLLMVNLDWRAFRQRADRRTGLFAISFSGLR